MVGTPTSLPSAVEPAEPKEPEVIERVAVPSAQQLDKARGSVLEILGEEIAAAQKPDDHLELCNRLLELARETKDDAASQYVLVEQAAEQAVFAHDMARAQTVVEELDSRFEVDVWTVKAELVQRANELLRTAQNRRQLARHSLELAQDLIQAERFDLADDIAQIAVVAATRIRDAELGRAARQSREQVQHAKRRRKDAQRALRQLATDPSDPGMNLVYGRYLCFQRGKWTEGVSHLSKGAHEALRNAAKLDAVDPSAADEQARVADAWYEAAKLVERADRPSVQQRFLYWARKAEPKLTGLAQAHVAKRIEEVEKVLPTVLAAKAGSGEAAPARPVQPPVQYRGLLGRIQAETGDVGVLWKYECGLVLSNKSVTDILNQVGRGPGRVRMEFVGMIYVPRATTVKVIHRGGGPDSGQLAVAVDGRKLGEVGGANPTNDAYDLDLSPGEHTVQWVLTGTDVGASVLQFIDSESGDPIVAYHSQALLTARRATPFRARLNVNMIRN
jgi:hypothetical protein